MFIKSSNKEKLATTLLCGLFAHCQSHKLSNQHYVEGIDISRYQENIDWARATPEQTGKKCIISKATQGTTLEDPKFFENLRNMSPEYQKGAYHFMEYRKDIEAKKQAQAQMEYFAGQLRKAMEEGFKLPFVALDVENYDKIKSESDYSLVGSITAEAVRFLDQEMGIMPYIYTRTSFWDEYVKKEEDVPEIIKECPLWIARWGAKEPAREELPHGWKEWKIWQYSAKGKVVGIETDVLLDKMKIDVVLP